MGQASAQRFVDRALSDAATVQPGAVPAAPTGSPAALPAPAEKSLLSREIVSPATAAQLTAGGTKTFWYACVLMCLGVGITAFSYSNAGPGQRYTVMWGPVALGVFLWGKAVFTGLSDMRSFAWVTALVSIAVPAALAATARVTLVEPQVALQQPANLQIVQMKEGPDGVMRPVEVKPKPSVSAVLVEFENAESATAKCDAVDQLAYVVGYDAIEAVDGLMEHYEFEDKRVQYCIRLVVRRLDRDVKFAEDTRQSTSR